jgi:hypothetical protein
VGTKKKQEGLAAGFPAAEKSVTKKSRQVRDSFTFPESDYAVIDVLKARALAAGREVKKSEILRAALAALSALPLEEPLRTLDGVERIKTGRPTKDLHR